MTDTSQVGNESLRAWTRALARVAPFARGEGLAMPALLPDLARRFGDRPALIAADEVVSYAILADRAARYAGWARTVGVGRGDVVCLLMANCPDYVAIWLGITAGGGVVALLNTNLLGDALHHAVATVSPTHVIVGDGFADAVAALRGRLPSEPRIWTHGYGDSGSRLDAVMAKAPPDEGVPGPALSDTALYIYTSGTTGLPKAARVSHRRIMEWSCWFAGMIDAQPEDRMYNCLPMYHSVGGAVAVGSMLVAGACVVVHQKFSASQFWPDLVAQDCTLFQYIGELCRYLVHMPEQEMEHRHRLRLCCGNGLRGDVWESFQARFRIPKVLEFYASTEGNVSLYNYAGRPGAIGHVPAFLAHRFPVALIRCDAETGEPQRGAAGLCIPCATGEAGEALGRIGADHGRPFEGYTDPTATDAKVLRDVLAPDDAWFRTGDLMRKDDAGYYYFIDRIGDTFRWKGENVATDEVGAVLRQVPGVADAIVYGVVVPGQEGRAGMATIVADAGLDLARLRAHVAEQLPDYARPRFLRFRQSIEMTGTFKPIKAALVREGFDPSLVSDPLYVDRPEAGAFVPLDADLYGRIRQGGVRL